MSNKVLLPLIVVICLYASSCSAIKCYTCLSLTDVSCADDFDKRNHNLTDGCAQCGKQKGTVKTHVVIRACLEKVIGGNECTKLTKDGAEALNCLCNTDGCNAASSIYVTIAIMSAPLLILAKHL
ncbi:hypothetical protein DPMN_068449 [Dreissena polymorpha]|uniref:Protein sleepless n=1 Tax=Dreissena polymorpha TaxID=45954 RepID=A0A9D3Z2J5_DREPO|nr:hypothetical protein DPMN_068449 [Dreissena polymorpha]